MWTVVECYLYTVLEQEILSCKVFLIMLGVCIMLELTSGHFTLGCIQNVGNYIFVSLLACFEYVESYRLVQAVESYRL